MTSEEIRQRIDQLTDQMVDEFSGSVGTFVLNARMIEYQRQIENLQNQCHHKFENGICIYCDKVEE